MDIESDDSERWEDFFGSSTDLSPSLLGLYDTLTGSFEINTPQKRQRSLPELNEADEDRDEDDDDSLTIEEDTSSKSSISTESDPDRSTKNHKLQRSTKLRNNIRVLSPNVQRLILHSDVEVVEKIDIDAIQHQPVNTEVQPIHRFVKKSSPKHQVKLSHIPLSRNTCKLTQSGNELVETFDSSNEYLDKVSQSRKHPQTPVAFDNDKTPTNAGYEAFNFDIATPKKLKPVISPLSHETEEFIGVEKVMELAALYDSDKSSEMTDVIEAFNYSVRSSLSSNSTIVDSTTVSISSAETIECNDVVTTSPTPIRKPSPQSSPLLTYARVKSLAANKANSSTPIPSPLSKTNNNSDQCKTSMESLTDRLTDMKSKFSPKESRKMSLMLPEIAKLKHRPLSSSSICSTSSSSSSGSDHLNGKLTTSYLASVESLADQSENELDTHNGSYSVFERACMEFVDSERSYVEDLGQVIRGYLEDWRERACLRTNELGTLFSNIEDIYDFNTTLLKQLINSGMDPVKIAKCFIDLRERFDVYTTYCTSYPEAISLLTSLLQATHTNSLLTSTQKMLQHTLPLGSYLLKPVQRILKYHLLLDNLRKHCDIKEVARAHEIMREVARNIDQVKRKLEQQSRVKELSGILDGWLGPELTVLGELRQEGLLMEHNKPRMVFLFATMLIITKPKEDSRLQFKSYIHQNNLMLNEHLPGEPTSFYVIPYDEPRNQIKLTAKNRDQKRLWAQHVKGVILEKFDNIPNRAKELVYKLGDEEDRTPDTNKWKWSLNNSKPIYLERRNEYRRSEIRNRSKIKRKTSVTNSTSFEGFNDSNSIINHRPLSRNHSMDDNMMPSLPKIGSTNQSPQEEAECCNKAPDCHCISRKSTFISPALSKFNKERSKSVPRISFLAAELDDDRMSLKGNLDSRKSKSTKSVEIKMYNTKTMPKRIATLKKNRSKKETSKFYMDLNEFEETVLKITESTENLSEVEKAEEALPDENQTEELIEPPIEPSTKEDAQIILDMLKNNKEFDRIYKKPQKKKSLDNSSNLNSPEPVPTKEELPPRPPSHSPPPLEVEELQKSNADGESNEPIYEALRRNVHVPYKFSPILNRSKSQQYYKPREKKSSPTNRPESDYVTLVYSASGNLQKIGNDLVEGISSGAQLRSSDSKINYETIPTSVACDVPTTPTSSIGNISQSEAIYARPIPKNLVKRLLSSSKTENVSGSENSLIPRIRKSVDTVSLGFGKSNKPPERRVSDVTEMCRQSIIHRQGSEAVGERMAHVDYADPKTLFANGSMNNSVASLILQRDSVFSLTSSSDSVCESSRRKMELSTNFEYEDDVEACLENDFRDSAIYSDDNEKRHDFGDSSTGDDYAPNSPPPLPPPRKTGQHPSLPSKFPTGISNPAVIMGPPHMSSSASRSWVLQQIENFSK